MDDLLVANIPVADMPAEAQAHLAGCPKCHQLAQTLVGAPLDPALLERVRKPIFSALAPVRLLPSRAVLATLFLLLFGVMTSIGASRLGLAGLNQLSLFERFGIFGLLLILIGAAAFAAAGQMRPGARALPAWALLVAAFGAFEALCLTVFHDYHLGNFVPSGVVCLAAGLLCALPTSLLALLVLRRGYVVAPVATGAVVGLGGGLVGLAVLEFHCPIQTLPHVAFWHTAIFVVSAAVGALGGMLFRDNMQRVPKNWANLG
jgi:hypothetical protein